MQHDVNAIPDPPPTKKKPQKREEPRLVGKRIFVLPPACSDDKRSNTHLAAIKRPKVVDPAAQLRKNKRKTKPPHNVLDPDARRSVTRASSHPAPPPPSSPSSATNATHARARARTTTYLRRWVRSVLEARPDRSQPIEKKAAEIRCRKSESQKEREETKEDVA